MFQKTFYINTPTSTSTSQHLILKLKQNILTHHPQNTATNRTHIHPEITFKISPGLAWLCLDTTTWYTHLCSSHSKETILPSLENILSTLENFIILILYKIAFYISYHPPKIRPTQITWPFRGKKKEKKTFSNQKNPKPQNIFPYTLPKTHFHKYNTDFCKSLSSLKTRPLKHSST